MNIHLPPLTKDQMEYLNTVKTYPSYDRSKVVGGPKKVSVEKILAFEELLKTQPQLELPVYNHFSHGIYARELHIPAGTILTGEIHKFSNLNILIKGEIKVSIGDEIELIEAPFIVVSPPGTKRVAQTLTDCIWITIHGTHETDLDKIRKQFIANDYQDWLEFNGDKQLELPLCHG